MSYRTQLCLVSQRGAVFGPLGRRTIRYNLGRDLSLCHLGIPKLRITPGREGGECGHQEMAGLAVIEGEADTCMC